MSNIKISDIKKKYWYEKVVLVTGGSSGLGREIAQGFLDRGARVIIAALEPDAVAAAESEMKMKTQRADILGVITDITSDVSVSNLVEIIKQRYGRLDVLVNNAGRTDRGKMQSCGADHFKKIMDLNFFALVRVTHAFLPMLLESHGHIINIGSLASKIGSRWVGGYAASKFAVAAYSQQLRLELAPEGIKVLLVCPGPVKRETERLYPLEGLEDLPESARLPGTGAKVKRVDPQKLVNAILNASEHGKIELVMPWKVRLLFIISQISPRWGDWLIRKYT